MYQTNRMMELLLCKSDAKHIQMSQTGSEYAIIGSNLNIL